jgi:glycine cleavage system H protein
MADIPEDLRYSEEHEWARQDGDHVTIGITDHAQGQLGDVVFVELPAVGDEITRGESFGTVESTKAVSELFAPLTGKVTEVNDTLADAPESVNEDPYGDGWMIRVAPSDDSDLDELMDAEAYKEHVEQEG